MEYKDITSIKPDPNQPRKVFDDKHIEGLSKSLLQEGIINPIEIDQTGMIITGECRFRAATLLGWTKVPVNINKGELNVYERLRRQMAENVHQSGTDKDSMMNPLDTARGYERLLKLRTHLSPGDRSKGKDAGISELAREIGIEHQTIMEYLGLLDEPIFIQKAIHAGTPRTYIREANKAPEQLQPEIKKKIAQGDYKNREEIEQDVAIARRVPDLATLEIERVKAKESTQANRILNGIASLALALEAMSLEQVDIREKGIVKKQLEWLEEKIKDYLK